MLLVVVNGGTGVSGCLFGTCFHAGGFDCGKIFSGSDLRFEFVEDDQIM